MGYEEDLAFAIEGAILVEVNEELYIVAPTEDSHVPNDGLQQLYIRGKKTRMHKYVAY